MPSRPRGGTVRYPALSFGDRCTIGRQHSRTLTASETGAMLPPEHAVAPLCDPVLIIAAEDDRGAGVGAFLTCPSDGSLPADRKIRPARRSGGRPPGAHRFRTRAGPGVIRWTSRCRGRIATARSPTIGKEADQSCCYARYACDSARECRRARAARCPCRRRFDRRRQDAGRGTAPR